MSDDLNWDFALIPNASTHGVHIGHLWIAAHLRMFYNGIAGAANYHKWPTFKPRYGLIFEGLAAEPFISQHIQMLEWLGWGPDFVWELGGWSRPADRLKRGYTPFDHAAHTPTKLMGWRHPIGETELKLFAMQGCPIHVRGFDQIPQFSHEVEICARNNLRMPEVLHVATLVDEKGVKIGDQPTGIVTGPIDESYHIMPLIENGVNPIDVLATLHRTAGGPPTSPWPENTTSPFGYFWQDKEQLANCRAFIRPHIPITIPKDWMT